MNPIFVPHVEALDPRLQQLLAMSPYQPRHLPLKMPQAGVYLFSEGKSHLYVGRSNGIRSRIQRHWREGSTHRMAAFAFRLAREATGNVHATYSKDKGSRADLMKNTRFRNEFNNAKSRIVKMNVRWVEETDPIRQTLLEIYVAVVLATPYNDFENH